MPLAFSWTVSFVWIEDYRLVCCQLIPKLCPSFRLGLPRCCCFEKKTSLLYDPEAPFYQLLVLFFQNHAFRETIECHRGAIEPKLVGTDGVVIDWNRVM